jgi:pimeloyl-ACP methyl ester carboxylesterase
VSSQLDPGPAGPLTLRGPVAALAAGAADSPVALLVPGYTGSKEDFAPVLSTIAGAGFRVVAIDLPGQYESPGRGDYGVDALGAAVHEVAAELAPRVHLLGHSFGGLVARAAVLADAPAFMSLVLMGSGPAGIDGGRRARMDLLRPVLLETGVTAVYDAMEQRNAAEPGYVAPPPALAAFLRRRFLAGDPAMLLGMGDALIGEPDRVDALLAAGLPTLVLAGAGDDAWSPAVQAEMAKRLDAKYVEVPDAAHSPCVENPAFTADALIRFWRSV